MMKHIHSLPVGLVQRRTQAAKKSWEQKNFQEAIELMESACRIAPSDINTLIKLGQYYGLRYDYAAAERCFEKALRLDTHKTATLVAITNHIQSFRNPYFVEHYLRRLTEQSDVLPLTLVKAAEFYERRHQLPKAAQLVNRALAINSALPAALLTRSRLERLNGNWEAAEQTLRSFISKPIPNRWVHAQSWYELAHNLDRQQRYEDAMAAVLQAKNLVRPEVAHMSAEGLQLTTMSSSVSPDLLQRWLSENTQLAPSRRMSLLCGYPRSGTTLLEQVLDAHPDIIAAEETNIFAEEVIFNFRRQFSSDTYLLPILEKATISALQQARSVYSKMMELSLGESIGNRLLVDKNPLHTAMIPAYIRILPETRFIIALRDPRDVVLSCFMQAWNFNVAAVTNLSLEESVKYYADTINIWQTLAPMMVGRYIQVRYEDMVEDLESVARKTLEFLGVPWDAKILDFDEHARKKVIRTPTYADVIQPIYKRAMGRWRNYQKHLEPHLEKLEPFVKAFGYG